MLALTSDRTGMTTTSLFSLRFDGRAKTLSRNAAVIENHTLLLRPDVEDDRYRPLVRELDFHPSAEDARRDRDAELPERGAERLVQRLGLLGRRRGGEARTVALRRIRQQRELADDERGPAHVEEAPGKPAVLVREGLLTPEQLEQALAEKERTGHRIGEIVVERGWAQPQDVARALAEQHGLEFVDLAQAKLEPTAANLLPEKFARRYDALPVRF